MKTLSPRQTHAANLAYIAEHSGYDYDRQMSFIEAETWIEDFEYYYHEGYPADQASLRAYDHLHASRKYNADKLAANRRG